MLDGLSCLKKRIGDSFQMVFLGDGPIKDGLIKQAESSGISSCVSFLGCLPNELLPVYYQSCDAFLFSSLSETQGIVLLEAMAAGCPVVAVDASGTRDTVVSGENGFLTGCNAEEWAGKAAEIVLDNVLHQHLSDGARRSAVEYHTSKIALQMQRNYIHALQKFEYANAFGRMGNFLPQNHHI